MQNFMLLPPSEVFLHESHGLLQLEFRVLYMFGICIMKITGAQTIVYKPCNIYIYCIFFSKLACLISG